jgi:methyltransferase (TIGR00027 family)
MLPGQPSRTLLGSSIMRAEHQLLDTPRVFDDPIVLDLVPEATNPTALAEFRTYSESVLTLLRSALAMRSRFAEDRLAEAVSRGVRQYVMIGAGLDTFPWRQPKFAENIQIFAADHPASLGWTQSRLRERAMSTPANLIYVPVDLDVQPLGDVLATGGFDPKAASFCSLLGVTQYLGGEAIDLLLRFVVSLPPGSEIVFSFVIPEDELDGDDLDVAIRSAARTDALGEPWKSRLRTCDLIERLAQIGFSDIFHLTPAAAQARYFAGRRDSLRAPVLEQLIAATV